MIHIPGSGDRGLPWLEARLELITAEDSAARAGASAVCERLSELMLTQALRAALLELQASGSMNLDLLRDRGIAPAVHAIHRRPEHAWTLGELADLAAMSRSAFADRFRTVTGDSPDPLREMLPAGTGGP